MTTTTKKLTTVDAANIARQMGVRGLCIYRDDVDRDLWRVVTPGRNEAHEPMDEKPRREFIAASGWITMHGAGKGRKVTVPQSPDAIGDDLSPEAVVAIAANLAGATCKDRAANKEI
jgi:hypothetical protein